MRTLRLLLVLLTLPVLTWGQTQVINGNRVHAGWVNYGTTGGTPTAYTLTFSPPLPGYVQGQCFLFKPHLTNTGAASLNVQGKGALALTKLSGSSLVPLVAGDLRLNRLVIACHDGTNLQLMGAAPDATGTGVTDGDKGDVTVSGTGTAWTIDPGAVTYTKLQPTAGASLLLGRGTAGAGAVQEITLGPNLSMTGTVLDAASPSGVPDGDKGDLTVASAGTVWTIDPGAVTYAKLPSATAASRLLGRGSASPGVWQEVTLGTNLSMSGTTLSAATGTQVPDGDKGDVTVSGSGTAWVLDPETVTYSKLQNTSAASVLLGRGAAAGAGDVQEVTLGMNLSMSGTTLNAAGGAGVPDGDKGDVTVSGAGTIWTIDPSAVTYAKLQNVSATARVLGRNTVGVGPVEELTVGTLKSMLGMTFGDIAGDLPYASLTPATAPARLLGRGSASAGDWQEVTLGTNLTISGTQLNATGGVGITGAPSANQLALWTDPTTLTGTSTLSFNVTDFDVSAATRTRPNKVGTTPPATCNVGDTFFDSDAAAGANHLGCTTVNTWTALGGGGPGGGVNISGTPTAGQLAAWTNATTIEGVSTITLNYAAAAVSTAGTVTTSTEYVTTGAGGITRTLPAAASGTNARRFTLLKVDAGVGALTIARAGADTINGSATSLTTTTQWAGFEIQESAVNGWVAQPISSTAGGAATFPLIGTSAANPCLAVGPNGATNPALQVNCSTVSAVGGVEVVGQVAGSGVALNALGTNANEPLTINSKGTGSVTLNTGSFTGSLFLTQNAQNRIAVTAGQVTVSPGARSGTAITAFAFTGAADTALTGGTEVKDFVVNLSQTKQHAGSGAIALQRHMHFLPGTDTCVTATCTITEDVLLAIGGPVTGGLNSTITRSSAVFIETRALTNVATGVGLIVQPPSGATTNLAAQFLGTVQVPANAATTGTRYACFDTAGNLVAQVAACSGT